MYNHHISSHSLPLFNLISPHSLPLFNLISPNTLPLFNHFSPFSTIAHTQSPHFSSFSINRLTLNHHISPPFSTNVQSPHFSPILYHCSIPTFLPHFLLMFNPPHLSPIFYQCSILTFLPILYHCSYSIPTFLPILYHYSHSIPTFLPILYYQSICSQSLYFSHDITWLMIFNRKQIPFVHTCFSMSALWLSDLFMSDAKQSLFLYWFNPHRICMDYGYSVFLYVFFGLPFLAIQNLHTPSCCDLGRPHSSQRAPWLATTSIKVNNLQVIMCYPVPDCMQPTLKPPPSHHPQVSTLTCSHPTLKSPPSHPHTPLSSLHPYTHPHVSTLTPHPHVSTLTCSYSTLKSPPSHSTLKSHLSTSFNIQSWNIFFLRFLILLFYIKHLSQTSTANYNCFSAAIT